MVLLQADQNRMGNATPIYSIILVPFAAVIMCGLEQHKFTPYHSGDFPSGGA